MINQNNPNNNPKKKTEPVKPAPLRKTIDDPENDLFDDELFGADSDFEEGVIPEDLPNEIPKILPDQKEENPDNFEKPW